MSRKVDREPCPYRIVDDAGNAFLFGMLIFGYVFIVLGFIGGSIWHFFGGIRNAPSGKKLELAWSRVTTRAPILGGLLIYYFVYSLYNRKLRCLGDPLLRL